MLSLSIVVINISYPIEQVLVLTMMDIEVGVTHIRDNYNQGYWPVTNGDRSRYYEQTEKRRNYLSRPVSNHSMFKKRALKVLRILQAKIFVKTK